MDENWSELFKAWTIKVALELLRLVTDKVANVKERGIQTGGQTMFRKSLLLIGTLGLVATGSPDARADLCFRYQTTGGGTLVARGAKLPAVNTCAPLAMFESGGLGGAATGSICVDINDFTIIFHYTYDACIGPGNYFESATCRLQMQNGDLPSVSSSCRGTLANGAGFLEINDAILQYCDGIPVPGGGGGQCVGGFSHHKFEPQTVPSR